MALRIRDPVTVSGPEHRRLTGGRRPPTPGPAPPPRGIEFPISDWSKDKDDTIVKADRDTGEVKELTVNVREDIVLQRHARIGADRNVCATLVGLVDQLARTLTARSIEMLQE